MCYVYGQRYIDYEKGPYVNRMHLWDFNSHLVKRPTMTDSNKPSFGEESKDLEKHPRLGPSSGMENAPAYSDPNMYSKKSQSKMSRRASGSSDTPWSLVPVYDTEPSVIKDKNVFAKGKVWSSLPYRRVTSKTKLPHLFGIMMDEERIILATVSYDFFCGEEVVGTDEPMAWQAGEGGSTDLHVMTMIEE